MEGHRRKLRSPEVYAKKVLRIKKWHNRLETIRLQPPTENPNTRLPAKRKELKPVEFYVEKVKKPVGKS